MNPKRTGASHVVPPDVNLGNISPGHRTAVPAPRAEPVPPNTALLGLRPPAARSSALDLSALREAQNYVRDLGIRFHQTGNRWVATNGVDPDDAGQSDACVELEVVSDASARRVETDAGIQSVAPIEIWHIQRGDAPPGTAHRLLAALLWHARIVPTKIFGVIQESTTRRLMQARRKISPRRSKTPSSCVCARRHYCAWGFALRKRPWSTTHVAWWFSPHMWIPSPSVGG